MSPFCVRHEIAYDRRENTLRLSPTTDEPPFSEFMQLINEAESGQRDSSPHAWADAEGLRKVMDEVLQGDAPCAHWLFLADRALPSESGLKSVRLLHKRDGQRQVLLAVGSHDRMAGLVRGIFDRCGLSMSGDQLQQLLEEGVNLSGAGLLDLIKDDGLPDSRRVLGLAGLLLAAQDYRQRYPDSLLVSVDNEVARLWLRLGRKGDRCDLLGVRREGETFIVEAIEVKTTEDPDVATIKEPVRRAQEQISAVLAAVSAAIPDSTTGSDPLSAPRCEMLKEVLVRGCQSRALMPEKRGLWSGWLIQLFRQEGDDVPVVQYRGEVVCVLPKSADKPPDSTLDSKPFPIVVRYLTAERIEGLLGKQEATARSDGGPTGARSRRPQRHRSQRGQTCIDATIRRVCRGESESGSSKVTSPKPDDASIVGGRSWHHRLAAAGECARHDRSSQGRRTAPEPSQLRSRSGSPIQRQVACGLRWRRQDVPRTGHCDPTIERG